MSKILKLLPSPPDDREMDAAVFATAWMAQQSLEAEIKSHEHDRQRQGNGVDGGSQGRSQGVDSTDRQTILGAHADPARPDR